MKVLEKIKENKIFFVTFALLFITGMSYLLQKNFEDVMDNYYYPLYVINYDCGYSSRLLVGAVFSLFFKDTLNVDILISVMFAVYALMCLAFSLFVNNHLKKTKFEGIGIYTVFMVLSPAFLSLLRYFGIVDVFWLFFVMGALLAVNKKGWRWLVPIFCIIGVAIHEVFLTTYLPVIAIAVLYQFINKPAKLSFIFVAVCTVAVGFASVYFLILGDGTMKMTSDEMVQFAQSRLDARASSFDDTYLRSVFFWEMPDVEEYEGFAGYLKYTFDMYIKADPSALKRIGFFMLSDILSSVPFVYVVIKAIKKAKAPAKKFVYLCSLIPLPLLAFQLLLSTDTERFSMHWLMVMLFLLLFFVRENDEAFGEAYEETRLKFSENKLSLAFFGIAVARIVLSGVRF